MRDYVVDERLCKRLRGEGPFEEEEDLNNLSIFTQLLIPLPLKKQTENINGGMFWIEISSQLKNEKNKTWELCDLPDGARTIGLKWVFKTKLNKNGKIDKYKARLMTKRYSKQYGVDYTEVFAPEAKWDTIRLI